MGLLKSPSGLWEEGALHMGEEWVFKNPADALSPTLPDNRTTAGRDSALQLQCRRGRSTAQIPSDVGLAQIFNLM